MSDRPTITFDQLSIMGEAPVGDEEGIQTVIRFQGTVKRLNHVQARDYGLVVMQATATALFAAKVQEQVMDTGNLTVEHLHAVYGAVIEETGLPDHDVTRPIEYQPCVSMTTGEPEIAMFVDGHAHAALSVDQGGGIAMALLMCGYDHELLNAYGTVLARQLGGDEVNATLLDLAGRYAPFA